MSNGFGRDDAGDRELPIVDLTAVQADDALLDALSGSDPKVADELGVAELNAFLLTWSREVDSEPMPELVDVDTALWTIKTASPAKQHRRHGGKRRLLVPVAAAAAVLSIAFGGAGVAARDARPGDTLWGLTRVLYADQANSVQASYDVRAEFKAAQDALDHGELDTARNALHKAAARLPKVRGEDDRDGLKQQYKQLMDRLEADPSQPSEQQPPPPTSKNPVPTSSPPPASPPATTAPGPSKPATPSQSTPRSEPPPTTGSTTTSNDASPTGSTSQPGAGSASVDGNGAQSSTQPVG